MGRHGGAKKGRVEAYIALKVGELQRAGAMGAARFGHARVVRGARDNGISNEPEGPYVDVSH